MAILLHIMQSHFPTLTSPPLEPVYKNNKHFPFIRLFWGQSIEKLYLYSQHWSKHH